MSTIIYIPNSQNYKGMFKMYYNLSHYNINVLKTV